MNKKGLIYTICAIILILVIAVVIVFVVKSKAKDEDESDSKSTSKVNEVDSHSKDDKSESKKGNSKNSTKSKNKTEEDEDSEEESYDLDEDITKYYGGGRNSTGWTIDTCRITNQDVIIVPETIAGYPVTEIDDWAFVSMDCKKIVLPDTVTSIGENAFEFCKNLEEIELGDSLTYITTAAFTRM